MFGKKLFRSEKGLFKNGISKSGQESQKKYEILIRILATAF